MVCRQCSHADTPDSIIDGRSGCFSRDGLSFRITSNNKNDLGSPRAELVQVSVSSIKILEEKALQDPEHLTVGQARLKGWLSGASFVSSN